MIMNVLKTQGLKKYYGKREHLVKAVDDINIEVKKGEFVAVVGKSGSGKSTLLHMLGALDRPTEGKVIIDNLDISTIKKEKLAVIRRQKLGFVFQYYNLISSLNVWENIVFPIGIDSKKADENYINDILDMLEISDKKYAVTNALSGGEQQRVAIARALANKPSVILADEPTGNLDSATEKKVLKLLRKSLLKYNQTLVMITHDEDIAKSADRIICLRDGKVV